jgi:hypothetical protein
MKFGAYHFHCRLETDALLPRFKGSTFRSVFGLALKQVVCPLKRQPCETCMLRKTCLYAMVFEPKLTWDSPPPIKSPTPPPPLVIEPPLTSRTLFPGGSDFDFQILLFGAANAGLPYFIYAIDRLGQLGIGRRIQGKRGTFILDHVRSGDRVIYSNADGRLDQSIPPEELNLEVPENEQADVSRLRLFLDTPLRLKTNNRLTADLPFQVLARAMLRRISTLTTLYGEGEPELDYRGLSSRSDAVTMVDNQLQWFDWQRYSRKQDAEMRMGGIIGAATYEGRIGEFMPLVRFCEKVHLGKGTTFGLGKFRAEIAA